MSGYPMDGQYYGNPGQPIMQPYPPGQPQFYLPQPPNQGPYAAQTNFNQPFPQYGAPMGELPPNQPYYNQQQQQQQQQQQNNSRQGVSTIMIVHVHG